MIKSSSALILAACLVCAGAAVAEESGQSLYQNRCQSCHGPDGGKAPRSGVEPLQGQPAADLARKLHGYQDGTYGGQSKQVMHGIASGLNEEQIQAVAGFIGSR